MTFLNFFKHILPRARAWSLTVGKNLRSFFEAVATLGSDAEAFFAGVWNDLFPDTTRELDEWENQFNLPDTNLSDADRRARLAGVWQAQGGQSPRYIQDALQDAGFDVYLHKWWEPGTEPAVGVKSCVSPRNPQLYLRKEYTGLKNIFIVGCGEPEAECGEAFMSCGDSVEPLGYPLVNKIFETVRDEIVLCGESIAECGEPDAGCGNYLGFIDIPLNYIVPADPAKWPYFLYVGGATFPDLASIPSSRRDEFEELLLKICPSQQWLGILAEYS